MLGRQVLNVNQCLKYGVVVSGEATFMVSNLLWERFAGVADVEDVLHLHQDFHNAIIRDIYIRGILVGSTSCSVERPVADSQVGGTVEKDAMDKFFGICWRPIVR